MFAFLSRYWWVLVLRGVLAVLFGVFALAWPGAAIAGLVLAFGAVALADGFVAVVTAIAGYRRQSDTWLLGLQGLLGIGVGVLTFLNPAITAVAFLILISVWAVGLGLLQIVVAVKLRNVRSVQWWLSIGGLVGITSGILFMFMRRPVESTVVMLGLIAAYVIVWGVMLIVGGFDILRLRKRASNWQVTGSHA